MLAKIGIKLFLALYPYGVLRRHPINECLGVSNVFNSLLCKTNRGCLQLDQVKLFVPNALKVLHGVFSEYTEHEIN